MRSISLQSFLFPLNLLIMVIVLTGCLAHYPYIEDRPIVTGNTADQFNALTRYAPDSVNVNISYEYAPVDIVTPWKSSYIRTEETNISDWYFQGRMNDNQHFYQIITYAPLVEDEEQFAGTVITQGRKRVTGYETCVTTDSSLIGERKALFEESVQKFSLIEREQPTDLYIRRFISNDVDEGGRRLETVFFVALADIGLSCPDYEEMLEDFDTENKKIDIWRDQALRAFEIIG